jgi:trehalose 6-phosphate phosphatase
MSGALPEWCGDWALFLDVDGTIVEIAATPAAVRVPPRTIHALANASESLDGALALVSGRSIADLDRLFAPLRLPAAGAHGAERRASDGVLHTSVDGSSLAPADVLLSRWALEHEGVLLERKPGSLALHYRNTPWLEPAARLVVAEAAAAAGPAFHVQAGKMVFELKSADVGKGRAIAAFMTEAPFADRQPVFIGDDLADESGFEVVNDLGGHSIAVGGVGDTKARWRLEDEAQVLRWIETQMHPCEAPP